MPFQVSHPPSPVLLRGTQRPVPSHSSIIAHIPSVRVWHQNLPGFFCLLFDILPENLVALAPNERHEHNSNKQRESKQEDVDGNGVVMEGLVGCGV